MNGPRRENERGFNAVACVMLQVASFLAVLHIVMSSRRVANTVERLAAGWDQTLKDFLAASNVNRTEICASAT